MSLSDEIRRLVLSRLESEYDNWVSIEKYNVRTGNGLRGPNGDLAYFDIETLLNEVFWRLNVCCIWNPKIEINEETGDITVDGERKTEFGPYYIPQKED